MIEQPPPYSKQEKKLSWLTEEEAIQAVEQGVKPTAMVTQKFETELPFIEVELPLVTFDIYGNDRVVVDVKIVRDYIYYAPENQMRAYRMKRLLLKSNEKSFKLKPGDIITGSFIETESYHREFGKLLGYSDEEVDDFIEEMKRIGQIKEINN